MQSLPSLNPLSLALGFRSYRALAQAHTHPYFQLILPSRGTLSMEIAGDCGQVGADCAAVVAPGERHAFAAQQPDNRFVVIDVGGAAAPASVRTLLAGLAEQRYAPVNIAAQHLMGYAENVCGAGHSEVQDGRLMLWLELLLMELRPGPAGGGRDEVVFARAKVHIERCYDRPLEIVDIARTAGLGVTRLYQLFRQRLGITPHAYLAQVRLQRALALLSHTRRSIADIAVRTGHADQSALTRALKRSHGVTPAAYRRARQA